MSKPENVKCPDCGGEMVPRNGQYGKFWGCKAFPNCKGTRDSMGRSKADREEYKRSIAEDHEDIGPDSFQTERTPREAKFSFNKK